MFRESLEVSFVVGIILAYLHKTKNEQYEKHIWLGVASGIIFSIILAFIFERFGDFERSEPLFEGIFMILTSALVSWLILWVVKQKKIVENLQNDVKIALQKKETMGLFILGFTASLREGVEAVLFMAGIFSSTGTLSIIGALLGIIAAVIVGFLVFEYSVKFNIGLFFKITTIILVLLSAGLFSQGIHELQEAKVLPTYIEHVYDINPPQNADGSYPDLHEDGSVGSIFKSLVGYDGDPSEFQVIGYFVYIATILAIYKTR